MSPAPEPDCAGVIVCGGESQRMGMPKALLRCGDETLLERLVRVLGGVVDPLVVVVAVDQELPNLPAGVVVRRDRESDRGPLEGIAVGLAAVRAGRERAYVSACDVPLLRESFVRRIIEFGRNAELAIPIVDGTAHPLAAVYSTRLVETIEQMLARGERAPRGLVDHVETRRIDISELRDVDPELASLRNVNRPEDYEASLAALGLSPPADWRRA